MEREKIEIALTGLLIGTVRLNKEATEVIATLKETDIEGFTHSWNKCKKHFELCVSSMERIEKAIAKGSPPHGAGEKQS